MTTRARTTLTALAVVAALAGGIAGCGGPPTTAKARANPSPTSVTASPTPSAPKPSVAAAAAAASAASPSDAQPSLVASPSAFHPFTGPAAARFGADRVEAAYKAATQLELLATVSDPVIREATPTLADVAVADHWLDRNGQAMLAGGVARQADPKNFDLYDLFLYGFTPESLKGYALRAPDADHYYAGYATTNLHGGPGGATQLGMRFLVGGNLLLSKAGKDYTATFSKDCTLFMVPDASGPDGWLVDSYYARVSTGNPVPTPTE